LQGSVGSVTFVDAFGLVGQVLDGQIRVDRVVGEGGFSVVYQGLHTGLGERVAIKCLKLPPGVTDPSIAENFLQRFRDESRLYYRLSAGNLHIVRSISSGSTVAPLTGSLVPYMALEWLEGRSLAADFDQRRERGMRGRTPEEVLSLFEGAADGLTFAHAQGVIHRDLNPGNFFLSESREGVRMKVLDFGVAKIMNDHALALGPRAQTIGNLRVFAPAYGAPEQFDDRVGAVGPATDVYALALIMVEALLDRTPTSGDSVIDFANAARDLTRRPTPRTFGLDVGDEIEATLARALKVDPKERWPQMGDFWVAYRNAIRFGSLKRHARAQGNAPLGGTIPLTPSMATVVDPRPDEHGPSTQRISSESSDARRNQTLALPGAPSIPSPAPVIRAASPLNSTLAMPQRPSAVPSMPVPQVSPVSPHATSLAGGASPVAGLSLPPAHSSLAATPAGYTQRPSVPQGTLVPAEPRPSFPQRAADDQDPPVVPTSKGPMTIVLVVVAVLVVGALVGGAVMLLGGSKNKTNTVPSAQPSASAAASVMVVPSASPSVGASSGAASDATDAGMLTPLDLADATVEAPAPLLDAGPVATFVGTVPAATAAVPAPTSSVAPASNVFNAKNATLALDHQNAVLIVCKKGEVGGPGKADVSFAPSGAVTQVTVQPPYAGTKEGTCVATQLRQAKMAPFEGPGGSVNYAFTVPK
jgi:eukaryotic-like serine/threonine-protein kinase